MEVSELSKLLEERDSQSNQDSEFPDISAMLSAAALRPVEIVTEAIRQSIRSSYPSATEIEKAVNRIPSLLIERINENRLQPAKPLTDILNRKALSAFPSSVADYSKALSEASAPKFDNNELTSSIYDKLGSERFLQIIQSVLSYSLFHDDSCDVEDVSVNISLDSDEIIEAKYNRVKLIDLLQASLIQERLGGEPLVINEGNVEEPNTLFSCSIDHDSHNARVHGETNLKAKSNGQGDKTISEWLDELQADGRISAEEREQIELDARRAEIAVRAAFPQLIYGCLKILVDMSIREVKQIPVSAKEFRAMQDSLLGIREFLHSPEVGRRKGTGWFRNEAEFKQALKEVFSKFSKRPTRERTVKELRQHRLCQRQSKSSLQSQAKTLMNWLERINVKDYEEAWKKYRKQDKPK